MKLTVSIYTPNTHGEVGKVGELRFDGTKITASDPDSQLLKNIAVMPIRWPGLEKPIDPKKEPAEFMKNLWMAYRSPYLTALKAVEGGYRVWRVA